MVMHFSNHTLFLGSGAKWSVLLILVEMSKPNRSAPPVEDGDTCHTDLKPLTLQTQFPAHSLEVWRYWDLFPWQVVVGVCVCVSLRERGLNCHPAHSSGPPSGTTFVTCHSVSRRSGSPVSLNCNLNQSDPLESVKWWEHTAITC